MKKILILILALGSTLLTYAQNGPDLQNSDLKADLQDVANTVANDLRSCCSSFGGNNLQAVIHWDEKDNDGNYMTRVSQLTNSITICTTVSWTGSMSGTRYWIKGKVTFNAQNNSRSWMKISDSGGFSPDCSNGCIK